MQVHVKLTGSSRVLINTHNLPGINAKALQLSKREERNRSGPKPHAVIGKFLCSLTFTPKVVPSVHMYTSHQLCHHHTGTRATAQAWLTILPCSSVTQAYKAVVTAAQYHVLHSLGILVCTQVHLNAGMQASPS